MKYVSRSKKRNILKNLVCVLFVLRKVQCYVLCEMYVTYIVLNVNRSRKCFSFPGAYYSEHATSLFSGEAFSLIGLSIRFTVSSKITVSQSLLCFFHRIPSWRPFWRWYSILHRRMIFAPWIRKTYGVLRIADFSLSYCFPHKNWNYCLKYCQSNQKKVPARMHPPCLFVKRVSCGSYALTLLIGYWKLMSPLRTTYGEKCTKRVFSTFFSNVLHMFILGELM